MLNMHGVQRKKFSRDSRICNHRILSIMSPFLDDMKKWIVSFPMISFLQEMTEYHFFCSWVKFTFSAVNWELHNKFSKEIKVAKLNLY